MNNDQGARIGEVESSFHDVWKGRFTFILASVGAALGLGNIWRFPYLAGENGGSAFVLLYIFFVVAICLPIIIAEISLGRRGRHGPIQTMRELTRLDRCSRHWTMIAALGVFAAVLILSYYTVISGWVLAYLVDSVLGEFQGMDLEGAKQHYQELTGSPWRLIFWNTVVMLICARIIGIGIIRGIERYTTFMMPGLFLILLAILGYSLVHGDMKAGLEYLFQFDASKINAEVASKAMGQAFYSTGLGMSLFLAYGAYMQRHQSIPKASAAVAFFDTGIALLMGIALFPIVFAVGLSPDTGPGLMFQTLVVAFAEMPGGWLIGSLFFLLAFLAALTSAFALLEPVVVTLVDRGLSRPVSTLLVAGFAWILGIGTVLSFNIFADYTLWDLNFFELIDTFTAQLVVPLCAILISLYVGWHVKREVMLQQLEIGDSVLFESWYWLLRLPVPLAVLWVTLSGLGLI